MTKLRPPYKIHGGKWYLQGFILDHFPEDYQNMEYVEPFVGAGSVWLNKDKSLKREVVNDLDPGNVAILRTLRDEPEFFIKKLSNISYTERVFMRELKRSTQEFTNEFDKAINEFVLKRMSRGGMKKAFAWSTRQRGGKPGDVNAWETILKMLKQISIRIEDSFILNKPAVEVIRAFNSADTLLYCDPPYDPDSRVSKDVYDYEMTADQHKALSNLLHLFKGKVLISGYPSVLYKQLYADWRCVKKKIANHSSQQKTKSIKTECLWMNY